MNIEIDIIFSADFNMSLQGWNQEEEEDVKKTHSEHFHEKLLYIDVQCIFTELTKQDFESNSLRCVGLTNCGLMLYV